LVGRLALRGEYSRTGMAAAVHPPGEVQSRAMAGCATIRFHGTRHRSRATRPRDDRRGVGAFRLDRDPTDEPAAVLL